MPDNFPHICTWLDVRVFPMIYSRDLIVRRNIRLFARLHQISDTMIIVSFSPMSLTGHWNFRFSTARWVWRGIKSCPQSQSEVFDSALSCVRRALKSSCNPNVLTQHCPKSLTKHEKLPSHNPKFSIQYCPVSDGALKVFDPALPGEFDGELKVFTVAIQSL